MTKSNPPFYTVLPELYKKILPNSILDMNLNETKATCDNCIMAKTRNTKSTRTTNTTKNINKDLSITNQKKITYQANLKCCTFHPFFPNFLIGATLLDAQLENAHQVIRDKIKRREYSLPIGMPAPVRYQIEFNEKTKTDFGNRADWLCPFYLKEENRCGNWQNRGVVCTTFFCKSSYGKKGQLFWQTMSDYLSYTEMAIMEESLNYLDFSPRQVSHLLGYLKRETGTVQELRSWVLTEPTAIKLWNGYYDEQEQFFIKSYQLAANLNRKTFSQLLGPLGQTLLKQVHEHYQNLNPSLNHA